MFLPAGNARSTACHQIDFCVHLNQSFNRRNRGGGRHVFTRDHLNNPACLLSRNGLCLGAEGHALVGKIADNLLTENAKAHINRIVGFSLEQSGPWLDCVRSVQRTGISSYELKDDPDKAYYLHPQCEPFFVDASAEKARMEDYVARNWSNCTYQSGSHGCHETYHFADVSITENAYRRGLVGTSNHDIVSTIDAAIAELKREPSNSIVDIKDDKEAIFLLAHLIGDLHQPLHVGAIYLDKQGTKINPDDAGYVEEQSTQGGNLLFYDPKKSLHSEWDAVSVKEEDFVALVAEARKLSIPTEPIEKWAEIWATDTLRKSTTVFSYLKIDPKREFITDGRLSENGQCMPQTRKNMPPAKRISRIHN